MKLGFLRSLISKLTSFLSNDIAIDLGTATTLVYVKGQGIVSCEPSVVAIQKGTNTVFAVGEEAKMMLGRTPGNIMAIRPLKDGVIADFDISESMLRYFIRKANKGRRIFRPRPRIVIAVPSGITEVERRAVKDSAEHAGARPPAFLVEEPKAAAIGVGLPIHEPGGNMIVDIGGGTTEVAVISLADIVVSKSVRVAGDEMDEAIIAYLKKNYNLLVGERTAEDIKIKVGSVYPLEQELTLDVKGRDLGVGLPKTITITSQEIREAMSGPAAQIIETIRYTLERTPPELSADLVDRGLVVCGGGALIRGMDKLISDATGLPVHVAENPLTAVVLGTGKSLSDLRFLKKISTVSPLPPAG